MDIPTILGIIIGIIIVAFGIWCCPPKNIQEKMEKMSPNERKKREIKNVIWGFYQIIFHPITLILIICIILFVLAVY